MKWRSFKTVPKNGDMVDLYHEEAGRIPDCYYEDGYWYSYYSNHVDYLDQEKFTHWMPCPDNPE